MPLPALSTLDFSSVSQDISAPFFKTLCVPWYPFKNEREREIILNNLQTLTTVVHWYLFQTTNPSGPANIHFSLYCFRICEKSLTGICFVYFFLFPKGQRSAWATRPCHMTLSLFLTRRRPTRLWGHPRTAFMGKWNHYRWIHRKSLPGILTSI